MSSQETMIINVIDMQNYGSKKYILIRNNFWTLSIHFNIKERRCIVVLYVCLNGVAKKGVGGEVMETAIFVRNFSPT